MWASRSMVSKYGFDSGRGPRKNASRFRYSARSELTRLSDSMPSGRKTSSNSFECTFDRQTTRGSVVLRVHPAVDFLVRNAEAQLIGAVKLPLNLSIWNATVVQILHVRANLEKVRAARGTEPEDSHRDILIVGE